MENGHFDLLLLDIMLPKINGYELMEYAKTTFFQSFSSLPWEQRNIK